MVKKSILVLIYLLALGSRIYWLGQKEGFHEDEGMSLVLSSYSTYTWTRNFDLDRPFTGLEAKNMALIPDDPSLNGALSDLGRLWANSRDTPHTNLYYSILRLALIGMKNYSPEEVILRGGIVNLIFFSLSFFFFYKLLCLLFPLSFNLRAVGLFVAFISTAGISNTLFIRPYQMQETVFMALAYGAVLSLNRLDLKKHLLPLALGVAISLLSGYYAIIFLGLIALYLVWNQIKERQFKPLLSYGLILLLGIGLCLLIYPKYLDVTSTHRVEEIPQTLLRSPIENVFVSIFTSFRYMHRFFFPLPALGVLGLSFIMVKFKDEELEGGKEVPLFFLALLFSGIIMILAPYKVLRYIMPVFPLLVLGPLLLFQTLFKSGKILPPVLMGLLCLASIYPLFREDRIENHYRGKPELYFFRENPSVPVYVINFSMWKYSDLVPYFADDQDYTFSTTVVYTPRVMVNHEEVYLVTEFQGGSALRNINLSAFEIVREEQVRFFLIRHLRRR
ncbi:MAG: hypothetical protein FWH12_04370 [Treponema sp.]|nr:hypothetical protein [Treponema sp.]